MQKAFETGAAGYEGWTIHSSGHKGGIWHALGVQRRDSRLESYTQDTVTIDM